MKKLLLILPLALILCLMIGCQDKAAKVDRIMEDGVEVVINHLQPYRVKGETHTLMLNEEYILDFEKEEFAELGVTTIIWFDVDSDNNVYFMNISSSNDSILKFDSRGNFLFSFGKKGQGPGELVDPIYLRVNELDQISISDRRKRKLFFFDKNGDFLKEILIASNHRIAALIGNGKILAMRGYLIEGEGILEFPIVLCNRDLEETKILHPGRRLPQLRLAKRIDGLRYYLDHYVWQISKKQIYVGNYGNEYKFLIYDLEGNLLRKIRKEYHKVEVPNQLKEEIINWFKSSNFAQLTEKIYFPKYYPPFQYFFVDEKGRLYVMTYERGKGQNDFIYDVFNQDGIFISRIELDNYGKLPFSYTGTSIPLNVVATNNRIYCLREKESGYKEMVVYKMIWE